MEDGAAEGAETLPYFTVNSTAVPAYDAFCSAPVRCLPGKCLPGSRTSPLLTASLTALETVRDSGPGYCLITSMPMDWSVAFCVEEGFLGAMRELCCCVSRDGRCTPIRAHRRCERLESTPGTGVDMRVPRYKVR